MKIFRPVKAGRGPDLIGGATIAKQRTNTMDYIQILEMLGTAFAASWLTRILTIRARVRQENAAAQKGETEVKADQIENIEKLVEKVYKPTIETLTNQVNELREKVDTLEKENDQLRAALRDLQPDPEPEKSDRRRQNGKGQPRNAHEQFTKEEEA